MKREHRKLVEYNTETLRRSESRMEDIYGVMFGEGQKENVLAEINTGYRIKEYTYANVREQIEKASAALYEKIGATHEFVALEMENRVEWIVAFWAILRSGNKPYLVNCRHPKALSEGIVGSLGIKYVVGVGESELPLEFIDITSLHSDLIFGGEFENEIALSTSATTMKETVCFYTGREMCAQILDAEDIIKKSEFISAHVNGKLKLLAFLPFYHIFGLAAVYFWFTFFGRTLVFLRDYSPDTILKTCRAHGVTHVFAVPMLWHTMEKEIRKTVRLKGGKTEKKFEKGLSICEKIQNVFPFLGMKLSHFILKDVTSELLGDSIRCCISGGSYIKDSTLRLFNALGYPLHNGYGMSEIGITSVELDHRPEIRNKNSVGIPLSSVKYSISERGTLLVKGTSLCREMRVNGEKVERGEWYDTGDVAKCVDGRYYIIGRLGDTVIGENGENINPDATERLLDIKWADDFSVFGMKEDADEVLTLVVKVSPYLPGEKLEDMIKCAIQSNEKLPMASRVKRFYITNDGITAKGAVKAARPYLKKLISDGAVKLTPFAEVKIKKGDEFDENSAVATAVRKIIAKELGISADAVGADTHLINDLGATSLQYFGIISDLAREFSLSGYSEKDTYCYTLREMCIYIERHI